MALLPSRSAPDLASRDTFRTRRERRLLPGVTWRYSLLFVAAVLAIALVRFTGLGPETGETRLVSFRVTDGASGAPLPGATVALGGVSATTDPDGIARFRTGWQTQPLIVTVPGYAPLSSEITGDSGTDQSVALVSDGSGAFAQASALTPVEDQEQPATDPAPDPQPTATSVVPTPVPGTAAASSPDAEEEPAPADLITGRVLGPDGEPVDGTYVRLGNRAVKADRRGRFELLSGRDPDIEVTAPGHVIVSHEVEPGDPVEITLDRLRINAVYLSGAQVGDDATVRRLIRLADDTEINAVVVDIKEYVVFYDTQVDFFRDADMVVDAFDPAALVRLLHRNGIYAIARQVVFKDPLVAEAYPDLAVTREGSDELWRGGEGEAWVNPFNRDLWQPNIDLAREAASFGFDEIQYDYIRFPSDGDLSSADFGPTYDEESRVAAIVDFLEASQAAFKPLGLMFAVDVFGVAAIFDDDQGIGQRIADIAPHVDYICPMVYPSHFTAGIFGFDQEPNHLPYETIQLSLESALAKIPGQEHKLRPWLQDFTYGEPDYGEAEVRAQIDATAETTGYGYLLWNANVEYTTGALGPEG